MSGGMTYLSLPSAEENPTTENPIEAANAVDLKHPFVRQCNWAGGRAVHYEQAARLRIAKDLEAQGDAIGLIRILNSPDDMRLQKAVKDAAKAALRRLEKKAKTYAAMAQMRERRFGESD